VVAAGYLVVLGALHLSAAVRVGRQVLPEQMQRLTRAAVAAAGVAQQRRAAMAAQAS